MSLQQEITLVANVLYIQWAIIQLMQTTKPVKRCLRWAVLIPRVCLQLIRQKVLYTDAGLSRRLWHLVRSSGQRFLIIPTLPTVAPVWLLLLLWEGWHFYTSATANYIAV